MPKSFQWDDAESYKIQREQRAPNIFGPREVSELQVSRLLRKSADKKTSMYRWLPKVTIHDSADLSQFKEYPDACQIFYIRQKRSWALLNIDYTLFQELLIAYDVFLRFWDFMFSFGLKHMESDIGHVPFRIRYIKRNVEDLMDKTGSFECAYGLRYVELNGRLEKEDHEPWSVRQTAIYQRFDHFANERCVVFAIAPAETAERRVEEALQETVEDARAISPFNLHRIFIADSIKNWRWYISSLEDRMTDQSNRIMLAKVGVDSEKLSPITNFNINFIDRQRLKILEDRVLDLQIIFDSSTNTVEHVRRQCTVYCKTYCSVLPTRCNCWEVSQEFDGLLAELRMNQKKAEVLQKRTQATAHLLSDLLDYENAQIAHGNEIALKQLAQESQEENRAMRHLTEKSTKDAAAIKILTIITLIYLPATVVANFFSSQFVQLDSVGVLRVAPNTWLFAATSLPLTVFTLAVWYGWVKYKQTTDLKASNMKLAVHAKMELLSANHKASEKRDSLPPRDYATVDIV